MDFILRHLERNCCLLLPAQSGIKRIFADNLDRSDVHESGNCRYQCGNFCDVVQRSGISRVFYFVNRIEEKREFVLSVAVNKKRAIMGL